MTEHNRMTAKGIAQKIRIDKMNGCDKKEFHELHEQLIKDFALQVATEAVEEEIEGWNESGKAWKENKKNAQYHGHFIIENIKNRLNDE